MNNTQVLEEVICFSLEDISLWGARKKLRPEDVTLGAGGELPPSDIASLGSKKIFNTTKLNEFLRLKKRAHTACAKVGIRFMGGYAVPASLAADLGKKLDKIGDDFAKAKADFLASYETDLTSWIALHPRWETWIRKATLPVTEIGHKFRYGWVPARVSAPSDDPNDVLGKKMASEVGGLAGRLFEEIAEMAEKVRSSSLLGKDKVNRRVLSSVASIRSKLSGLSFLDQRAMPVIKAIDEVVASMPGDAPIEGLQLSALYGLMVTLADPQRLQEFGQAVLDGTPVSAGLGVTIAAPIKAARAPAPVVAPAATVQEPVAVAVPASPVVTPATAIAPGTVVKSNSGGYIDLFADDDNEPPMVSVKEQAATPAVAPAPKPEVDAMAGLQPIPPAPRRRNPMTIKI